MYVGHLPRHFEEAELAAFLKQFGSSLVNLKLVRSLKTGRSRGYAFVQFKSPAVAAVVADTLSGYLFLPGNKRLVCHVVPASHVHAGLFARRALPSPPQRQQHESNNNNMSLSLDQLPGVTRRLVRRERQKRRALQKMGVVYDFPGYEASLKGAVVEAPTKDNNKAEEEESSEKKDVSSSSKKDSVVDSAPSKKKKKKRKDSGTVGVESKGQRKESIGDSSAQSEGSAKRKRAEEKLSTTTQTNEESSSKKKRKKKKKR